MLQEHASWWFILLIGGHKKRHKICPILALFEIVNAVLRGFKLSLGETLVLLRPAATQHLGLGFPILNNILYCIFVPNGGDHIH